MIGASRNDILWIMHSGTIVEKLSMHMLGLDAGRVDAGDPDLEVEKPARDVNFWIQGGGRQDAKKQVVLMR